MKQSIRRKAVIKRLTAQLKSGVKTTKDGSVPLTSSDIARIEKELSTLSNRLK